MKRDLEGKSALFVCILNGSFMFAADLMKELELLDAEISFLKLASYSGTASSGEIKELIEVERKHERQDSSCPRGHRRFWSYHCGM